jgi:predicted permease
MRRLFRLSRPASEVSRDLSSELHFHLEMRTQELVASGLSPEAARSAALRAFGDVAQVERECRGISERRVRARERQAYMRGLVQDLRYALRTLRKSPGFTFIVVLTLALGIGANTAIFSMVRGVLLRPLPYRDPGQLVFLRQPATRAGVLNAQFSVPELTDYRAQSRALSGIVEYHSMPFILLGRGEPRRVQTGVVSANFFDLLGVTPALGRTFRPGEDAIGAEPVLVLSYGFWKTQLGGDASIVGKTFTMNDHVHTVIGVLPPIPQYPGENDIYMPSSACPFRSSEQMINGRQMRMLTLFGRLAPGVTASQAQTELDAVAKRLHTEYPGDYHQDQGFGIVATPLQAQLTAQARPTLLLLLGTAAFVLLIACATVANLSLARLVRREREMALRAALGADRGRLVRQLLAEGLLLAGAGAVAGLALAWAGLGLLTTFAARFTPRSGEIALDAPVLLFGLGLGVFTGLLFGLLPALPTRVGLAAALKDGGATTGSSQSLRARAGLVVAQVAVSVVLLVGAGLMLRTVLALQSVDPGFDPEQVLGAKIDLNFSKYTSNELVQEFHQRLRERLAAQPGIQMVASSRGYPLDGRRAFGFDFQIERRQRDPGQVRPQADFQAASPDYFRALGIPLVTGRLFTDQDGPKAPSVAIISQAMARRYWPSENPVGQRVTTDSGETWTTIVGIVGDVHQYGLDAAPVDEMYLPFDQVPLREGALVLRGSAEAATLVRRVKEEVLALDPDQPLAGARPLVEVRGESLAAPRLTATLLGIFAGLALVITAAGLAGLMAFSVNQRTQEIGVRMALGAARSEVLGMILRQGLRLVCIGLAVGAVGALSLSRLMAGLLFGIRPHDAATFALTALLLLLIATLACLVPARRAATVDPMVALRST